MPSLELRTDHLVAGGRALAREADGRVVFVDGALPGELVRAEVRRERGDFAEATVAEVLEPSPHRVEPSCAAVARGCGGCDLAHVARAVQPEMKADLVRDALRRLGGIDDPPVEAGDPLPEAAYRTTARLAVVDGVPGYRRRASHDVVTVDHCPVAHPSIDQVIAEGRFPSAGEVTVRAGVATGERLVWCHPSARGAQVPDGVVLADRVSERSRPAAYHEEVAGRRWRVSARSFFQSSLVGVEALVAEVRRAARGVVGPLDAFGGTVADLYCGVGVLGGSVVDHCADGTRLVAVEQSGSSARDARHNLRDLRAAVHLAPVEEVRGLVADLVLADPARAGLGKLGVAAVAATGAVGVVVVSCDAAALGRDTRLLGERGYLLRRATLVDLFPDTSHVEVVARFVRA